MLGDTFISVVCVHKCVCSIRIIYSLYPCLIVKISININIHSIGKGDVTIKVKDDDFMDMASGKLSPQKVCPYAVQNFTLENGVHFIRNAGPHKSISQATNLIITFTVLLREYYHYVGCSYFNKDPLCFSVGILWRETEIGR